MQRSRAGQSVPPETLATYTAAKGFLISEWVGATLMVYSFTHLYLFGLRPDAPVPRVLAVGVVLLVLGTVMWWRSRVYYLRLDFPWRRGAEIGASLVASTAIVFWGLFALAAFLASRGISLLG